MDRLNKVVVQLCPIEIANCEDDVLSHESDSGLAIVLNRPKVLNAVNLSMKSFFFSIVM